MRTIDRPLNSRGLPLNAKAVFKLCIGRIRDAGLKVRLESIADVIGRASVQYDTCASTGDLHQLTPDSDVAACVTNAEMVAVYKGRFAASGSPGRKFYDRIRALSKTGVCPLCGVGKVTTLDHQLPKTRFSCFTVTPNNLVPACKDCQDSKGRSYPTSRQRQPIHPYFDNFESEQWLNASIQTAPVPAFSFHVVRPPAWSTEMAERAKHHLRTYGLPRLYSMNAASEMASRRATFERQFVQGTLKDELEIQAGELLSIRKNSWLAATYVACARSSWFYGGGFRLFTE
jgi:hypothetical protein